MLGRRKKAIEDFSMAVDVFAAVILLASVYLMLRYFRLEWEAFLTTMTGYPFRIEPVSHLRDQGWLFLSILFMLFASLKMNRFYQLDLFARTATIALHSFKCILIGISITALFFYFFYIIHVNRSLLFGFAGAFFAYHVIKEKLLRAYLLHTYHEKSPLEALLVCPAFDVAHRLQDLSQKHLGSVRISRVVLTEGSPDEVEDTALHGQIAGGFETLPHVLSKGRFDLVFLGESTLRREAAQKVLDSAEEQGVEVWYLADFLSSSLARPHVDEYGGHPVIVFKTTSHIDGKFIVKRIFDIFVAATTIAVLLPVFLIIALLVKLTSAGPVFYVQQRTGFRGKPFDMLKFRTMRLDAEEQLAQLRENSNEMKGPVFKSGSDPRITPLGRVLRRYSLDELPQLFNVMAGHMSLVGPRPLPVYETENFEAFKDHRRYTVLPGLTGLWQVSGRNRIEDFSEWVRLDLEYIDRWSLWLDIVILFRTLPAVLSGDGAK